ncbi:AMP-binding protein [Metallosphaera tengchongensis]|uniref:acetate--CoA ligase n=1 Tax=Metallosphaera tengchongensis TaxID=1532350 RepID=A0A6N0NV60_9CREN|nr:AMP-binding protein [Metallosphaera tengchongensis]QKR00067.1 AMP-binding protein [Metallosphaera tengchongensis]
MIWRPDRDWIEESNIGKWLAHRGISLNHFQELSWSKPEVFWPDFLDEVSLVLKKKPKRVLDTSLGREWAKWFVGASLNISDQIKDSPDVMVRSMNEEGDIKELTSSQVLQWSKSISSWLKRNGLRKGDRVAVYMPMRAEIVPIMLGIVRAGMIVVPLFSGYGEEPIRVRLEDSEARAIFTVDSYKRKGKEIEPFRNLEKFNLIKIALKTNKELKDYWNLEDLLREGGDGYEETESEDPLMIIYTSGTTGKPKGCVHVHGGFPIKAAADMYFHFDVRKTEFVSWISDMGWMMGPWLVFGSLILGANMALLDGFADSETLQRFISSANVKVLGLSASLIRSLRASRPNAKLDVRVVGNTGEPIDPESWNWVAEATSAPVINYSGGTEISGGILGNYVVKEMKPSAFNGQSPGIRAEVMREDGQAAPPNYEGELVILSLWPGMTRGFWKDPERYISTYWSKWKGVWVHGDLAMKDSEGYFYILGRSDDTIKVSGKRVGPGEIEAVINSHPAVVESACVGVPDQLKGERIICLAVPKIIKDGLEKDIVNYLEEKLGKALMPSELRLVPELPKTRNAKIMRRLIRNTILGRDLGDISSLENPQSLEIIKKSIGK